MSVNPGKLNSNGVFAQMLKNEPVAFSLPKSGDLVQGKVLEKNSRRLILDLGKSGTGVVYQGEMQNAREVIKNLKPGDELAAKVLNPDNEEGMVELSLTQADKQKAWTE